MRKLLTMAMALVMAVCVAMPVYAQSSVAKNTDTAAATPTPAPAAPQEKEPERAKGENGATYWVTATSKTIPDASAALAQAGVVTTGNATVAYLQDIHADSLPLEMTFYIGGGDPNALLYVLHWNGSSWEQVAQGSGNWVHARFTSLSPVAVIRVTGVPAAAGARTTRTAPQTGEPMTPFVCFAVLAMAGVVAMKARKKEM